MASFTEHDLKPVPLVDLQEAAHNLEIAQYGKKADIAARIVSSKGGKGILKKLISTSLKKVKEKKGKNPIDGPKAAFMKKERARLVASGVTDKKKINEELKRLWTMYQSTSKPLKTIVKKTPVKKAKAAEKFINSSKLLPDSVCKARNLTLVGSDSSTGKTVYKYKVKEMSTPVKGSPKKAKKDDDDADDDSDDDFDDACAEVEERAISRIKSKKFKREVINGFLEAFGVDASGWTLPHAKEEIVVQLLNETDDENSDDEEEEEDDDDDEDSDDDEEEDDE